MSVRINTNIEALNAQRNLGIQANSFSKSVEKLSSGLRINRAADDAAGLAISQKLDAQVRGVNQATRNAQDGISMIQTAEGALNEVHSMLQRMRELAVQASNSTLSQSDAQSVNSEMQALWTEVDRVAGSTTFNGQNLLTGSLSIAQSGGTVTNGAIFAAGGGGNTSNLVISGVDVSGGAASKTYTVTGTATDLTLSDGSVSQKITTSALTAGNGAQTFNFDKLGVKFTVTATNSAGTGATAADLGAAMNAKNITTGAGASANFQIGANQADSITVTAFKNMQQAAAGWGTLVADLSTFQTATNTGTGIISAAKSLITSVDTGIGYVSTTRGDLGAVQNRLEHTIANLGVASENLSASESRIKDLDVAAEMVNFTKTQILQQAGTAILAQANQAPQNILSLLR